MNADESSHRTPPRGPGLLVIAVVVAVLVIGLIVGIYAGPKIRAATHADHAEQPAGAKTQYYTCGMHPWIVLPEPGDCPICGMTLVPLDPAKFSGEVTIDPVVSQNIGVRTSPIVAGPLTRTLRIIGNVDYDETRLYDVNIKTPGWIEKLYVDTLGQPVHKGDPLFDLYSPELYAAQSEYLAALHGPTQLLDAARTRLKLLDVTDAQIAELEKRGSPGKTLRFTSPADGIVIAKQAVEGMKVNAGLQVYRIADLSKVWVMATAYEDQLPYLSVGQSAVMSLPYLPGRTFSGKILYIYPYLDQKTRQISVRLEFDNPNGLLKPNMYATVMIHAALGENRTLAPRSAVIDTGERKVAFVSMGDGRFEPRHVKTGMLTDDDRIEILDGLKPGDQVVTSGQFLIDSEAKMREALAKMIRGNLASDQKTPATPVSTDTAASLPDDAAKALNVILTHYLSIQSQLASDSITQIPADAQPIAQAVDELLKVRMPDEHFWHKHDEAATVRGKALELMQNTDIKDARQKFGDLSVALNKLLLATGIPSDFGKDIEQLHCPMFHAGQGGTVWLQIAGDVRNPYYGSAMIGCFDARHAMPVAGHNDKEAK